MNILSFIEFLDQQAPEPVAELREKYYAGQTFAGAHPAHQATLARAQEMEQDGASEDEIFDETNWFKGKYDDKWRIELEDRIDLSAFPFEPYYDKPLKHTINEGSAYVKDIVKDEDFLTAYPRIAELEVQLMFAPEMYIDAEYTPLKKLVFAQAPTVEELVPYLVHEIQHAIQTDEDFARGGDPNMFMRDEKGKMRAYKDRRGMYMTLAGEIEARDVQARAGFTPAQRKHIKPFSSEDYPRDTARIIYDD